MNNSKCRLFDELPLIPEVPTIKYFFEVTEDNLMGNNFNMIIFRKENLSAGKIVVTDIDLIKYGHQQFGLIGEEVLHLNDQLPVQVLISMVDIATEIKINTEHAKIF